MTNSYLIDKLLAARRSLDIVRSDLAHSRGTPGSVSHLRSAARRLESVADDLEESPRKIRAVAEGDEEFLIWIRDPKTFPFVRVKEEGVRRTGHPGTIRGEIVLGYTDLKAGVGKGTYRRIFTLHDYDYPIGEGSEPMALESGLPSEAVDPLTLEPNRKGYKTERCLEATPWTD